MTLENLLKTGQLKRHEPAAAEIRRLLAAAKTNLADAGVTGISAQTRFSAGYSAILKAALAALMANGFIPDNKQPGHHAVALNSLPKTVGLDPGRIAVFDALRRKRNLLEYEGEDIDESSAQVCRNHAAALLREVEAWLRKNHPDLVSTR